MSCDYTNDNRSSIVDALSTMVVDGNQLKVFACTTTSGATAAAWLTSPATWWDWA